MLELFLRSVNYSLYINDLTPIKIENTYFPAYLDDYYIKDSVFLDLSYRSLSLYTDQYKNIVVDSTLFYNVSSPQNYGAVFIVTNGNCLICKACAFKCYSQNPTSSYQFGSITVGIASRNDVLLSSASSCPFEGNRQHPLSLSNGFINVDMFNLSYNTNTGTYSGIYMSPTQPFSYLYSTHYGNTGNGHYHFRISCGYQVQGDIKYCNFIYNRLTAWGNQLFYYHGEASYLVEKCIFARNLGTLFAANTGTLGSFILLSCSIAHQYSGTYLATVSATVKSVVVTSVVITQSYALEHLSTVYCIADLPFSSESISELCLPPTPPQSLPPIPTDCFVESITGSSLINVLTMVKSAIAYLLIF